jgi:hypothetical protein
MEWIKSHKWLFAWSASFLLTASLVKFIPMSKPMAQLTGGIELVLAIATGIVFGITAARRKD